MREKKRAWKCIISYLDVYTFNEEKEGVRLWRRLLPEMCILQCHLVAAPQTPQHGLRTKATVILRSPSPSTWNNSWFQISRSSSSTEKDPSAAVAVSWNKNQPFLSTVWHTLPAMKYPEGSMPRRENASGLRAQQLTGLMAAQLSLVGHSLLRNI